LALRGRRWQCTAYSRSGVAATFQSRGKEIKIEKAFTDLGASLTIRAPVIELGTKPFRFIYQREGRVTHIADQTSWRSRQGQAQRVVQSGLTREGREAGGSQRNEERKIEPTGNGLRDMWEGKKKRGQTRSTAKRATLEVQATD
jgi:hypothetical protein